MWQVPPLFRRAGIQTRIVWAGGAAAADALAKLIGEPGEVMVIAFQAGASTSDGSKHLIGAVRCQTTIFSFKR